jgi:hypothetical protein
MPSYQYEFCIAERYGKGIFGFVLPKEISWKVHYVNGKQVKNWADVTLYNYLEERGAQGWEVADMTSHLSVRSGSLPVEHLYIILKKTTT